MGIKVVDIEISEPLKPLKLLDYPGHSVWPLIRLHGEPIGWLKFNYEYLPVSVEDLAGLIAQYHTWTLYEHSLRRTLDTNGTFERGVKFFDYAFNQPDPVRNYGKVTALVLLDKPVVPEFLATCLSAIQQQSQPASEIIAATYHQPDQLSQQLIAQTGAKLVAGANFFNRAVEQASGEFVAITGQMAIPDKGWLQAIARTAENSNIAAITGPFFPQDMDTDAQTMFEQSSQRPNSFERVMYYDEVYSIAPERFGVPLNSAFRRSFLLEQATTTADITEFGIKPMLKLYYRALEQGFMVAYELKAFIKERYPRELQAAEQQLLREERERLEFMRSVGQVGNRKLLRMQLKAVARSNSLSARLLDKIRGRI